MEINKNDLLAPQQTAKVISSLGDVNKIVGESGNNLKELTDLAKVVENIIIKVVEIQSRRPQPIVTASNGAPATPMIQYVEKQIDEKKVIDGLRDLLVNTATKLPEDIQELKIKDLIGENFKTLKVKVMGIDATGENLLEIITSQLVQQMKSCYK